MRHPRPELVKKAASAVKALAGKTLTIKFGGELVEKPELIAALADDILILQASGVRTVLCHGGGPQVSRALEHEGVKPVFHRGQRVTDDNTLRVICRLLRGEINAAITAGFNARGASAVGLSGVDGGLLLAERGEPELGWVGQVKKVNGGLLDSLLAGGFIPVIASVAADEQGRLFNVNADLAASAVAAELRSAALMLFTNVEGVYSSFEDKSSLIRKISAQELRELLPKLSEGMIPKVEAALTALTQGVASVKILDGRAEHAILKSLGGEAGTEITPN